MHFIKKTLIILLFILKYVSLNNVFAMTIADAQAAIFTKDMNQSKRNVITKILSNIPEDKMADFVINLKNLFSLQDLQKEEYWNKIDQKYFSTFLPYALKYAPWESLSLQVARETLPGHIDASLVPHGDIAIPSKKVHSGRYIISQWQRVATGAAVIVLGREGTNGELYVALGAQRGKLVQPQGYMESYLPNEDLTGLGKQGASRINRHTNELVKTDNSLEDNAVREVKEELGIDILKSQLKLLSISSERDANPILHTITAHYGIILPNIPELKTIDIEFTGDDLQKPLWINIKGIKCIDNNCFSKQSELPIHKDTIQKLQNAIKELGTEIEIKKYMFN